MNNQPGLIYDHDLWGSYNCDYFEQNNDLSYRIQQREFH